MENDERRNLADITETYYEELGKINHLCPKIPPLKKKEAIRLRERIKNMFYAELDSHEFYIKFENMVDKNETKKAKAEYVQEEKESKPSILKKMLGILKRKNKGVEIQPPEDRPRLEQGNANEEVVEGENGQSEPPEEPGTGEDPNLVF